MKNKVTHVVLAAILAVATIVPAGLQAEQTQSHLASTYSSPVGTDYDLLGLAESESEAAGPTDGEDDSQHRAPVEGAAREPETKAPVEDTKNPKGQAATQSPKDYLIYFTATWCGPCQGFKPTVHKIRDEALIKVIEVDIDKNPGAASQWGVTSVPTTVVVKNGKIVSRHNRPVPYTTLKGEISP